jgi:iron complex outermembrane recepter protein
VDVQATRQQLPGNLAPTHAGGQTASGAQIGMLGKLQLFVMCLSR